MVMEAIGALADALVLMARLVRLQAVCDLADVLALLMASFAVIALKHATPIQPMGGTGEATCAPAAQPSGQPAQGAPPEPQPGRPQLSYLPAQGPPRDHSWPYLELP